MSGLSNSELIILAGGRGTRLGAMTAQIPKPLIEVRGRPFLYWVIKHFQRQGARSAILSTGYLAEKIECYPWAEHFPSMQIHFSREQNVEGTGGAVLSIFEKFQKLQAAWVVNGDTFLTADLPSDLSNAGACYTALSPAQVPDGEANIVVQENRVVGYHHGGAYVDAGAIWVSRSAISLYRGTRPCSIHAILEESMRQGTVSYCLIEGTYYDIGTPERLERFRGNFERGTK